MEAHIETFATVNLEEAVEIAEEARKAADSAADQLVNQFKQARKEWADGIIRAQQTPNPAKAYCSLVLRVREKDSSPYLEWSLIKRIGPGGNKTNSREHLKKARGSHAYALPMLLKHAPSGLDEEIKRIELQARRVRELIRRSREIKKDLQALISAATTSAISEAAGAEAD